MTISINQVTSGMGLRINDVIYMITEYNHVKPGKGSAFVRIKMKNVKTNSVLERTFKTADKLEDVPLEERRLKNSYRMADGFCFMDLTTYEEVMISEEVLGECVKFLQDDLEVTGIFDGNQILRVDLPIFITSEVTETEPGFKGDSSKAGTKPATIDNGSLMQVPLFVDVGDWIKIDTRTGSYVERVKK